MVPELLPRRKGLARFSSLPAFFAKESKIFLDARRAKCAALRCSRRVG